MSQCILAYLAKKLLTCIQTSFWGPPSPQPLTQWAFQSYINIEPIMLLTLNQCCICKLTIQVMVDLAMLNQCWTMLIQCLSITEITLTLSTLATEHGCSTEMMLMAKCWKKSIEKPLKFTWLIYQFQPFANIGRKFGAHWASICLH